ncbi:MAG TPA: glycosyltransferase family protein [Chitinophagaceae bacterium]
MKIFYAVQATGNGHISRAMELLPYLQQYGEVDIFLSGDNSNLQLDAPIKYRSKGISLYYNCHGGLNYWQMIKEIHPIRVREEIKQLPVEKYDLILNDFDYITSAACARKKMPSIHFGHQASFLSPATPRPAKKSRAGEWLLKQYVKATQQVGLHFESYDDFIFGAVVKKEICNAVPTDKNYITVYLPSYCEPELIKIFQAFPAFRFEIFSRQSSTIRQERNMTFLPVNKQLFNNSLIHCSGLISGGGFETPAEALQLGKKFMARPIRGQYEQQCNAAALKQLGITTLPDIDEYFSTHFYNWICNAPAIQKDYSNTIPQCLDHIFNLSETNAAVSALFEEV